MLSSCRKEPIGKWPSRTSKIQLPFLWAIILKWMMMAISKIFWFYLLINQCVKVVDEDHPIWGKAKEKEKETRWALLTSTGVCWQEEAGEFNGHGNAHRQWEKGGKKKPRTRSAQFPFIQRPSSGDLQFDVLRHEPTAAVIAPQHNQWTGTRTKHLPLSCLQLENRYIFSPSANTFLTFYPQNWIC